jgi:transcription termination factor Rho
VTDIHEQALPTGTGGSASADAEPGGNGAASRSGATRPAAKRGTGLSSMLLPELQQMAKGLGISTTKMKKSDLVAAIQGARSGSNSGAANGAAPKAGSNGGATRADAPPSQIRATTAAPEATPPAPKSDAAERGERPERTRQRNNQQGESRPGEARQGENRQGENRQGENRQGENRQGENRQGGNQGGNQGDNQGDARQANRQGNSPSENGEQATGPHTNNQGNNNQGNNGQGGNNQGGQQNRPNRPNDDDDDFEGGRRRGRRYRDRRGRNRERPAGGGGGGGQTGNDSEPTVTDDDVLTPVAGVVDCIEDKNAWFVRVEGFFASPDDLYVANSIVRRYGLRRGDAITGAVRALREGERRVKYNPLVRLDTINGLDPEQLKNRVEFTKLTPLYPQERLRLETEPHILTTRIIDLVMPIGKGQRALIVSPPKAGKTMVLQSIANAIATNNPECHLMVVLVDERPEEVTDMQRSVRGEVIASTFDRKPVDHTTVAELSIERAKRLVEMGHDVVVLLDSITRLGRAYNLAAPASGRILSGGVDSTALYPPKRFLGAARNIENGGSLTILATALVETGSAGDTVIFEEFKGTGNAELKLDRKIADKRVFPAVDVDQSSTRKEEILLSPDELAVTIKLRRVLHALEPQQAIELLLDRLRKTRTNIEFLMQIAKTGQD